MVKAKDSLVLCVLHLTRWGHEPFEFEINGEEAIIKWLRTKLVGGGRTVQIQKVKMELAEKIFVVDGILDMYNIYNGILARFLIDN